MVIMSLDELVFLSRSKFSTLQSGLDHRSEIMVTPSVYIKLIKKYITSLKVLPNY